MAKDIKVSDLAVELGVSDRELLALCNHMGIAVGTSSDSLVKAHADRVRLRAKRDGLTRPAPPTQKLDSSTHGDGPSRVQSEPPRPRNIRVHELAKELGMTNAEMFALCETMGVGVKSYSSTMIAAHADRLRQRAQRDGLTRPEQPADVVQPARRRRPGLKRPTDSVTPDAAKATDTIHSTTGAVGAAGGHVLDQGAAAEVEPSEQPAPRSSMPTGSLARRATPLPRRIKPTPPPPPALPPIRSGVRCRLDELGSTVFIQSVVKERSAVVNASAAGRRVLAHADFVDWMTSQSTDPRLLKRARFVLTELARSGYARGTKSVKGAAAGWLRAPLGGASGYHFYLWYVTGASSLGRELGVGADEIVVREVRHHDDTDVAVSLSDWEDLIELGGDDVLGLSADSPFTEEQVRVARAAAAPVQTLRGYPGSGKTTALLLAALHATVEQVLYVTFSQRLVADARSFLETFLPDRAAADVLSYPALLEELADAVPGSIPIITPADGAARLKEHLVPHVAEGFGQWNGLIPGLYDELHAYAFGRSLPFEFRGIPASSSAHLDHETYERLRAGEGLGAAAKDASRLLAQIDPELQRALFPGPFCARSLLADVAEPPPERFARVGLILVDEVQDLTPVELLVILNVAARIGVQSGVLPRLMFAGDESQTVRATDFEWGWMRDLVRAVLPDVIFEDFALDINLRSPALLGEIVEATQNQYKLLDKRDRPSGQSKTTVDASTIGRVIYCSSESGILNEELLDLASRIPRCAIVYPGSSLPQDLVALDEESLALPSSEAKGLDFETVIVLDAGQHEAQFQQLLDERSDVGRVAVRARTLADQFRVAVSRSTFNLVLLDRAGHRVDALSRMLGEEWRWPFETVDFADLESELDSESDPEELLRAIIEEIEGLLSANVSRALARARTASRRLDRMRTQQDVAPELAAAVDRARGLSAAVGLAAAASGEIKSDLDLLEQEVEEFLPRLGLADTFADFRLVADLWSSSTSPRSILTERWLRALADVEGTLIRLGKDLPTLVDRYERFLLRWLQHLADAPNPIDDDHVLRVASTARSVAESIGPRHDYAFARLDTAIDRWAERCSADGRPDRALVLLASQKTINNDLRGRCLEMTGALSEAVDAFVAAGRPADAVRCARRLGDAQRAMTLNAGADPAVDTTLSWISALAEHLDRIEEISLLPEEADRLRAALDHVIERSLA